MNLSDFYSTFVLRKKLLMIDTKLCRFFITANKLASFKSYIAIKLLFDGNIESNKENVSILANKLNISTDAVRKHIKTLVQLNFLEKGGKKWFHIVGNKRFKLRNGTSGRLGYAFTLSDLQDTKRFRTLCRAIEMQEAAKAYSKNTQNIEPTKKNGEGEKMVTPCYTVSISWLSSSTGRKSSTIAKHRSRAKQYGLINYKRTFQIISCTEKFERRTATNITQKSILLFHDCTFETTEQLMNQRRFDYDLIGQRGVFPFFNKDKQIEAIVKEQTPELTFNFQTKKRNVNFTKEEKIIFKSNYAQRDNYKN